MQGVDKSMAHHSANDVVLEGTYQTYGRQTAKTSTRMSQEVSKWLVNGL